MRTRLAALVFAAAAVSATACAAPVQNGGVIVLPGAMERLLTAMRLGYGGMGDAKAPARVRRAIAKEDIPAGSASTGRVGDWLLETHAIVAVVADVDGSARGGQLVDLVRGAGGVDDLGRFETVVAGRRVRYTSQKTGSDDATGTAYVQVTGHPEGDASLEVVTRYDLAPELAGVVIHTSIALRGRTVAGFLGVGDVVTFTEGATRITASPVDVAAFGTHASYALSALGEPPFVGTSAAASATLGVGAELVATATPEDPFIYSRMISVLERPDDVALATTRASAVGRPVGEVEIEVVPLPRRAGHAIAGGRVVFRRADGTDMPLALPIAGSIRPGDRRVAKLPTGRYVVTFESEGYRSLGSEPIRVAARVLTPIRLEARRESPQPAAAEPEPTPAAGPAPETPLDAGDSAP